MRIWTPEMDRRRWCPGSVLTVPGDFFLVTHYFISAYIDYPTGLEWALQSLPGRGVHWARIETIIRNKPVNLLWRPRTPDEADIVIYRMRTLLGRQWDLRTANCEHCVRFAWYGKWESTQLDNLRRAIDPFPFEKYF